MSNIDKPTLGEAFKAAKSVFWGTFSRAASNPISETIILPSWTKTGEGKDIWSDEDYNNVYKREPWVYSCVNAIADDISKLKLEVLDATGEPIPEPLPEQLQILVNPSQHLTIKDLLRAFTIDEQLFGEAFANFTGDEILWMPSMHTRPVVHPTKCISRFEVESNGNVTRFDTDEVIYLKRGAPDLLVEGMSHLTPLADTMIQMAAQVRYEKGLWANDARPSGILVTEQKLDQHTRDELVNHWTVTYGGAGNAGKTAMLSNGLSYERMGMSQEETQYLENRKAHREEILAVFNVPPVRIGLLEYASYANAVEQMSMYWGSTILPLADRIAAAFEAILFPGTGFRLRFNADHIEALTIAKSQLYQIAVSTCGNKPVITQNEARQLIGMPPHEDPEADELNTEPPAMPNLFGPAAPEADTSDEMESFEENVEEDLEEDTRHIDARSLCIREALQQRQARHHIAIERETEICNRDVSMPLLDAMEEATVKAVTADIRKHGLRTFEQGDRPPDVPLPSEFDADLKANLTQFLLGTFERVVDEEQSGLNQLKRNLRQYAKDKSKFDTREVATRDFSVVDPAIMEAIERRTVQISTVPKTIQAIVRTTVANGVAEGKTIQEIADSIRALFANLRATQAMTIARTEAGSGTNEAAHLAQSQAGVTKKAWSQANAGQDKRSSHTINQAVGEILFSKRFPGNGMLHPQESGFPAGETINCMCVSYATDFE